MVDLGTRAVQNVVVLFHSYFETFDVISEVPQSNRLHFLDMTTKCSSKEELGNDDVIKNLVWL